MRQLWNRSLVFKFFLSYIAITIPLFAGFSFYFTPKIRDFHIRATAEQLANEARLVARLLANANAGDLDERCREIAQPLDVRITIVGANGNVIGDSARPSDALENHNDRPEIIQARASGTGTSVRYSTTIQNDLLYSAVRDDLSQGPRIIRLAIPLTEINTVVTALQRALLSGLFILSAIGLALAYLFSRRLTRRVHRLVAFTRQLANGSFPQHFFRKKRQDEIAQLETHLNEMSDQMRRHLEAVVAEKDKADSILRCMIEGVLVLDKHGHVLLINRQAEHFFHLNADENIHGASIAELSRHPDMHGLVNEALSHDFSTAEFNREIELDGGRWFHVNAGALTDSDQILCGVILVFHNITELKRLETLRTDFVANVSHELRTPLTAIRGYVETLLQSPPDDPAAINKFLGIIERHTERLTRLTEDLLTISDLESGRIQLNRKNVAADDLLRSVMEVLQGAAEKKAITLHQSVAAQLPTIRGDQDRLQQLFINVIENAIKYTPPNGEIHVTAEPIVRENHAAAVEIAVTDNGPGIPEHEIPRITERFYRVDKARSRDLGGTGLGLSIVKHITHAHGGELKIDSTLGEGTTVCVIMPAAETQQ